MEKNRIVIAENMIMARGGALKLTRAELPSAFLKWQSEERLEMFSEMSRAGAGSVRRMPSHLPVLATIGQGPFPVNLATRGMGMLPKPERLAEFTTSFEAARREGEGRAPEETLARRAETARAFYGDPANFDPSILGGLEIFEGRSEANLKADPLASLLYAEPAPRYLSFQINGVVDLVDGDDPRFRFLLAARELFAMDAFHIRQTRYPHGYLFYVCEVLDKTPVERR
ncbi:MAG TPA: hypothetical protein DIC34_09300 [Treponema sp.]|nr:MAG: hypothetical protein A2Y36_05310 [Treponema sp. GWA1_62_8]OHE64442.1 MAG: hypothetical protein A2001_02145 [Treponema sp. GWC1_61_84]OHE76334.1 MAG: hypothetical protein A2413_16295 [Treponema sp. RIFOXYC1_FULL_61_9]HCM26723.1 hypothetical protein [Treponema sp.]